MNDTANRTGAKSRSMAFRVRPAVLSLALVVPAAAFTEREEQAGRTAEAVRSCIVVGTANPLTHEQEQALRGADSLLVMIPGVSSGNLDESRAFLDRIRARGMHGAAVFFDWEAGNLARRIVAPAAVESAATRLLEVCETFQRGKRAGAPVDLLAHSSGAVVVNKAARAIARTGAPVRFRHVLFLGTALGAEEPLRELMGASARVLNVHSAYDKVNRSISGQLGRLSAFTNGVCRNLRMDYTLSGRLVRHEVFLSANPENGQQYGTYLATGQWPAADPALPGERVSIAGLHRLALWVREHPGAARPDVERMLPAWLRAPDPDVVYYAAVLAGLLKTKPLAPAMEALLEDAAIPVGVRKEIYQAFGNFEDGAYLDLLRSARQRDRACGEEIRDVLRALKRKRVEAPR